MSIASLIKRPATLIRRSDSGKTDEFGTPIQTPTESEVPCALQQRRRDERDDQGELAESLWDLFLPYGTELDTGDAVVVNGETYELVGEPWNAEEGSQAMWHVEATVRKVG